MGKLTPSKRVSVQQTYDQIISDFKNAIYLLPLNPTGGFKSNPSRPAAYAMLSKVYLSMQDYENALLYSDSCLQLYNTLMDYKTLTGTTTNLFKLGNPEVILHERMLSIPILPENTNGIGYVDTSLFNLFSPQHDYRTTLFFRVLSGRRVFKGSYNGGTIYFFTGIGTDEIYLIRSECFARKGNIVSALADLNTLLAKRYDNTYVPITATDAANALNKILLERRKELCFRGIRWSDLRRLNQVPQTEKTLKRVFNDVPNEYSLFPNNEKYVYPIPNSEILYSNVPQNPR